MSVWSQDDAYQLFELSDEMLGIANKDGYLIYVNSAWQKFFNRSSEILYAQQYIDFIHPADQKPLSSQLADFNENKTINIPLRFLDQPIIWKMRRSPDASKFYIVATPQPAIPSAQSTPNMLSPQDYLRLIINGLFKFVAVLDTDCRFLEINDGVLQGTALQIEDVLHQPFAEMSWWSYSPIVKKRLEKSLKKALQGHIVRYDEVAQVTPDQYIHIDFALVPIFDETGQIIYLIASGVDISERVQNQNDLEESLLRLNLLYQMTHTVMGVFDQETLLEKIVQAVDDALEVNRVSLFLLNQETEEVVGFAKAGKGVEHIYQVSYQELMDGLTGWVMRNNETILSHKGTLDPRESPAVQERRTATISGSIMVAPIRVQGKTMGTITAINSANDPDFTNNELALLDALANQVSIALEKLELSALLKASEQKYRELIDTANDMVYRLDQHGNLTFANPSMRQRLGYTAEELVGQSMRVFVPPEHLPDVQHHYQKWLSNKITDDYIEYPLMRKDGVLIWFGHSVQLIWQNDEVVGIHGFSRDISKRKAIELEREQLIQDLHAFSHTVAHDLKNPISGIVGFAELIEYADTPAERRYYSQRIAQAGFAMKRIIDELLRLAEISHQHEIEMAELKMEQVVGQALERLAFMIHEYEAHIHIPDTWHSAKSYAPWIEEIWANYISNAIKYGNRPPQIELGNDILPDQRVRFWVKDNGEGMSEEEQQFLFMKFSRLGNAHDIEGHGLGLSIVKRIADKLGLEVQVESELNNGSCFSFIVPT